MYDLNVVLLHMPDAVINRFFHKIQMSMALFALFWILRYMLWDLTVQQDSSLGGYFSFSLYAKYHAKQYYLIQINKSEMKCGLPYAWKFGLYKCSLSS